MGYRPGRKLRAPQRDRVSTSVSSWLNFTPQTLPGLQLWLDAADNSTITESGGSVTQWNDKSGNGYNVTQDTAANRPTLVSAGQNGLDVISFDGNDGLARTTATALGRNVTGLTAYVVVIWTANPTSEQIALQYNRGAGTAAARTQIAAGITSGKARAGGRTLDANNFRSATSSESVSTTNYQTIIGVFDYANTDLFLYLNGVLDGSNTSFQTATTTSDTDSLRLVVGGSPTGTSALNGRIAEILVYHSAHTTQERAAVLQYFKQKWNV